MGETKSLTNLAVQFESSIVKLITVLAHTLFAGIDYTRSFHNG